MSNDHLLIDCCIFKSYSKRKGIVNEGNLKLKQGVTIVLIIS